MARQRCDRGSLEGRRAVDLSDKDLLAVIRSRGDDLRVAEAMAALVRLFEHAAKTAPAGKVGLEMASSLTKLYSQNFAAGHPSHPFVNFALRVEDIVRQEHAVPEPTQPPAVKPPAVKVESFSGGGKSGKIVHAIRATGRSSFTRDEVKCLPVFLSDGFTFQDLNNAIAAMVHTGEVKNEGGVYRFVREPEEDVG